VFAITVRALTPDGKPWQEKYDGAVEQRLRRLLRKLEQHRVDPTLKAAVMIAGTRRQRGYDRQALRVFADWLNDPKQTDVLDNSMRRLVFEMLGLVLDRRR